MDQSSKENQKFAKEVAEGTQRGTLRRAYLARIATELNTVLEASRSTFEARERSTTKRGSGSKRKSKWHQRQKGKKTSKEDSTAEGKFLQPVMRSPQQTAKNDETLTKETGNRIAEVLSQVRYNHIWTSYFNKPII